MLAGLTGRTLGDWVRGGATRRVGSRACGGGPGLTSRPCALDRGQQAAASRRPSSKGPSSKTSDGCVAWAGDP